MSEIARRPAHYAPGVRHGVQDLDAASEILLALDFQVKESSAAGSEKEEERVFDNGAFSIHLYRDEDPASELELEVRTPDLDGTLRSLGLSVSEVGTPVEQGNHRVCHVRLRQGMTVRLVYRLREDELSVVPALPTQLDWSREAESLVQEVLSSVPEAFRQEARGRYTARAEYLAGSSGAWQVDTGCAARGVLQETPAFRLAEVRALLVDLGYASVVEAQGDIGP